MRHNTYAYCDNNFCNLGDSLNKDGAFRTPPDEHYKELQTADIYLEIIYILWRLETQTQKRGEV